MRNTTAVSLRCDASQGEDPRMHRSRSVRKPPRFLKPTPGFTNLRLLSHVAECREEVLAQSCDNFGVVVLDPPTVTQCSQCRIDRDAS